MSRVFCFKSVVSSLVARTRCLLDPTALLTLGSRRLCFPILGSAWEARSTIWAAEAERMAALDFKEIPEAHLASGLQDTFELFARVFLAFLGYQVEGNPSRGADGRKDVVVVEKRSGVGGETRVRWLVSCKHKAHSGASVKPD